MPSIFDSLKDSARPASSILLTVAVLILAGCSDGSSSDPVEQLERIVVPEGRGLKPDLAFSSDNFANEHFNGSAVCSDCHSNKPEDDPAVMVDASGRDLSIGQAWKSSMMANSARDPYWHAVMASELNLYANLSEELNDTCTRCHAPMANEVGRKTGNPLHLLDSGSEANGDLVKGLLSGDNSDDQFNHAMDGVSCSLCHQMADDGNLGQPEGMTGEFHIEAFPEEDKNERPAYGQYADVNPTYMQTNANFKPVHGPHLSSSESCGTCHNLVSESVDRNGQPLADPVQFPEQMTYSEWKASAYADGDAQTCQSCHMPVVNGAVAVATIGAGGVKRENFAEHTFLGANTVMLDLMSRFRVELGIDNDTEFSEAITRNRAFLQTSAELNVLTNSVEQGTLNLDLEVINNAGHKLPSGYHSRRVWLHVLVTDNTGQVVFESGAADPDGSIVGLIEDVNPFAYEPHYDVISSSSQVQVYQSVMGNSDNERTHSLVNGNGYLKDNRLLPAGFNKNTVSSDVRPAGAALSDNSFNGASDKIRYRVPVEGDGPYNVLVELNYQPIAQGHLLALYSRSSNVDEIDRFRTLYESTSLRYETITSVVATSD